MPLVPILRASCLATACWLFLLGPAAALPDDHLPPPQTAGIAVPPGQVQEAIDQLDRLAEALRERSGVPGFAVAVVHEGELAHSAGFGVRRVGQTDPVTPSTVFQLASLSKPLSATVVARQITNGIVAWEAPVLSLLPWFELADPEVTRRVTVGDLFSHRSGLPDHAGDDLEDLGYDRRHVLERLALLPLQPFRTSYAYTNFGVTAAAEAVAAAAGTPWEEVAETALYRPLGMSNTSSRYADFQAQPDRAQGHVATPDGFQPLLERQPDAQSAAGGVSSTVEDMANWMIMLLDEGRWRDEGFIASSALLPAITPQAISSPAYAADARAGFYGYGFDVGVEPSGRVRIGHSGAFYLGAGTTLLLIPSLELGIVVLTNASPIGMAEALAMEFADLAQYGQITRDWLTAYGALTAPLLHPVGKRVGEQPPAGAAPASEMSSYIGRYSSDYFGEAEVLHQNDGLLLVLGPAMQQHRLSHWEGDSFTYPPFGENAPLGSLSEVVFALSDGTAETMTIEFLDANGLGTFHRLD